MLDRMAAIGVIYQRPISSHLLFWTERKYGSVKLEWKQKTMIPDVLESS
jgi:hypothetical protein